jgi:hypothetical protein
MRLIKQKRETVKYTELEEEQMFCISTFVFEANSAILT